MNQGVLETQLTKLHIRVFNTLSPQVAKLFSSKAGQTFVGEGEGYNFSTFCPEYMGYHEKLAS